jgi:hypothetical protein
MLVLILAAACGEPLAKNVPRPPVAEAAGLAAAAAAAATLADPEGAARRAESDVERREEQGAQPERGVRVDEMVPPSVFDRIDRPGDAAGDAAGDAPSTGQPDSAAVSGAPDRPAALPAGWRTPVLPAPKPAATPAARPAPPAPPAPSTTTRR